MPTDKRAALAWVDDADAAGTTLADRATAEQADGAGCPGASAESSTAALAPLGADVRDRVSSWSAAPASVQPAVQSAGAAYVQAADALDAGQSALSTGDCAGAATHLTEAQQAIAQGQQAIVSAAQADGVPGPT